MPSTDSKTKEKKSNVFISTYLVLYNLVACAGWAYVLYISISHIQNGTTSTVWSEIEMPLKIVQTSAILEIIHSKGILGFVSSPVQTVFMQVFSRVWTLWAVMDVAPSAQASIFMTLACTSWGLVEVPRYLFYALDQMNLCPYPLLWLRYSLFAILYPTGITGELGCMYYAGLYLMENKKWIVSFTDIHPLLEITLFHWVVLVALTYIPGSPKMYMHMVKARSKSLSNVVPKGKEGSKKK